MISHLLAERLHAAGVRWTPTAGDRFFVPGRDLDDQVFFVSDMVVEVHELPAGRLLKFNGTTEWALDSILQQEVVWLPTEGQLRALLGGTFAALERTSSGYLVTLRRGEQTFVYADADAECAYALAVLGLVED